MLTEQCQGDDETAQAQTLIFDQDWYGINATDLMPHGRQVIQCSRRQDISGAAQTKLPFASPSPNSEAPVLSNGYSVVRTARHLNYADQDVLEERLWCILGLRPSVSQPAKFSPSPVQAGSRTSGSNKVVACVAPSTLMDCDPPYSASQNKGLAAFEACRFQRGMQLIVERFSFNRNVVHSSPAPGARLHSPCQRSQRRCAEVLVMMGGSY